MYRPYLTRIFHQMNGSSLALLVAIGRVVGEMKDAELSLPGNE